MKNMKIKANYDDVIPLMEDTNPRAFSSIPCFYIFKKCLLCELHLR